MNTAKKLLECLQDTNIADIDAGVLQRHTGDTAMRLMIWAPADKPFQVGKHQKTGWICFYLLSGKWYISDIAAPFESTDDMHIKSPAVLKRLTALAKQALTAGMETLE